MGLLVLVAIAAALYLFSDETEEKDESLPKDNAVQRRRVSGSGQSSSNPKPNRTSITKSKPRKRTIVEEFDGDETPKSSGKAESKESKSSSPPETSPEAPLETPAS